MGFGSQSVESGSTIYSYELTLTRAQIHSLHTVAIQISAADLGLSATQAPKVHPLLTEWRIKPDGSAFTRVLSPYINVRGVTGAAIITRLYMAELDGIVTNVLFRSGFPSGQDAVQRMPANVGLYVDATGGEITGGGADATIVMTIYYEKIEVTF